MLLLQHGEERCVYHHHSSIGVFWQNWLAAKKLPGAKFDFLLLKVNQLKISLHELTK